MTDILEISEFCSKQDILDKLGGDAKQLQELMEKFRYWLTLQPHLPQDIPDGVLENFILYSKLNSERAKQRLDMYYTLHNKVPQMFDDRDPLGESVAAIRKSLIFVPMPKLSPEKYRINIFQFPQPDVMSGWDPNKAVFMILDIFVNMRTSLGDVYVVDMKGLDLHHLTKFTPVIIKNFVFTAKKAYGLWVKGLHIINATSSVTPFITMLKAIVKEKLGRIHNHENLESLHEHVPKKYLSADYGGEGLPLVKLQDLWYEKMIEMRDLYVNREKFLVKEHLRPSPLVDIDDLFGIPGSFRKLDID